MAASRARAPLVGRSGQLPGRRRRVPARDRGPRSHRPLRDHRRGHADRPHPDVPRVGLPRPRDGRRRRRGGGGPRPLHRRPESRRPRARIGGDPRLRGRRRVRPRCDPRRAWPIPTSGTAPRSARSRKQASDGCATTTIRATARCTRCSGSSGSAGPGRLRLPGARPWRRTRWRRGRRRCRLPRLERTDEPRALRAREHPRHRRRRP